MAEERNYLRRVSKIADLDKYMSRALRDKFGKRFVEYRNNWKKSMNMDYYARFPIHLDIDAIDACNLNCGFCDRKRDNAGGRKISIPLYKKVIDEASIYKLSAVTFGMGNEPTLNTHLPEMIEYAVSKGVMDVIVGTNGQALSVKKTVDLIKCGITRITFSVDAATKETYKSIRKKNLSKVEENIYAVLDYREKKKSKLPLVRVSFLDFQKNHFEREGFIKKWIGRADYIDIQDFIKVPPESMSELRDFKVRPFVCPQPWQRLTIASDGMVYPCCSFYYKFLPLGNAQESTLKEIWDSKEMAMLRSGLKDKKYSIVCKNCFGSKIRIK